MVPTEYAKETFLTEVFQKKIIKNPYGVNLKEFYYDKKLREKKQNLELYILDQSLLEKVSYTYWMRLRTEVKK